MEANYHVPRVVDAEAEDEIGTALERLIRDGARRMLERALTAEVDGFLGRQRYARGGDLRGYRNWHQRPRQVAGGTWSVPVLAPRVSDVPAGTPAFESEILPKRQRLSNETQKLFARQGTAGPEYPNMAGNRIRALGILLRQWRRRSS